MEIVYIRVHSYGIRMHLLVNRTQKQRKEIIRPNTLFIRSSTTAYDLHTTFIRCSYVCARPVRSARVKYFFHPEQRCVPARILVNQATKAAKLAQKLAEQNMTFLLMMCHHIYIADQVIKTIKIKSYGCRIAVLYSRVVVV